MGAKISWDLSRHWYCVFIQLRFPLYTHIREATVRSYMDSLRFVFHTALEFIST